MSRIYGTTLIEKYFKPHPDSEVDKQFRENAGFFNGYNAIYKYDKLENGTIKISFREVAQYRDIAIVENGKRVGVATQTEPHTIITRSGTFICTGVTRIVEKPIKYKWRKDEVTVAKRFWSKWLILRISNKHVNIRINCGAIYPDSYTGETKRIGSTTVFV